MKHLDLTHREKLELKNDLNVIYYRSPNLYHWLGGIWLIMMIIFEYFMFKNGMSPLIKDHRYIVLGLLIFDQLFVAIFFFFGLQNLIIPLWYSIHRKAEDRKEVKLLNKKLPNNFKPRVKLLYTTYNDFLPYAAAQCMDQTYENCQLVILDNSNDQHYVDIIRQFCLVHPEVQWIRKVPNKGAKAGNLNNYLNGVGKDAYDYFVILDADELLQNDFVEKSLKFFYYTDHLGVLQANHISGSNTNQFQSIFSKSGNFFWPVQNGVRSSGSSWLVSNYNGTGKPKRLTNGDMVNIELGHGTMISKKAMRSIGNQMPIAVAEDLCLSFVLLEHGWNVRFSTAIYGNEQFPISMNALMIRSSKFCSANFEFFNRYLKSLYHTKMFTLTQKLDLLSFTLSVPIFALEYISLVLNSIVFPLTKTPTGHVIWFLIPTLVLYFSQSIADSCFQLAAKHRFKDIIHTIIYELNSGFLYGSFYYTSVKATFFAFLGRKAKFNVTPKEASKITVFQALKENCGSIIFSLLTIIICWICSGSGWILLSFFPGTIGWIESFKANHQSKKNLQVQRRLEIGSIDALLHPDEPTVPWDI